MLRTKEFQEGGHNQSGEPREAARPKGKHSMRPRNKAAAGELGECRGAWANSLWHLSDAELWGEQWDTAGDFCEDSFSGMMGTEQEEGRRRTKGESLNKGESKAKSWCMEKRCWERWGLMVRWEWGRMLMRQMRRWRTRLEHRLSP